MFTDCDDDDCHGTVECICDSDGVCEEGEDCTNCPEDCISSGTDPGCGNGVCELGIGEDCISCPSDCAGKQVGTAKRQFCCGDGDGNNPVGCEDERCNTNEYTCISSIADPYCCGDGECQGSEDECNCSVDCGSPLSSETGFCADGVDDDCDGSIDCDDSDCDSDPACTNNNDCLPIGSKCSSDIECCSSDCRGKCR